LYNVLQAFACLMNALGQADGPVFGHVLFMNDFGIGKLKGTEAQEEK
jgi:hypothetical protein